MPHENILYDLIAQHNEAIIEMKASMDNLLNETRAQTALYVQCQHRLESTVPNGDYDGHRRYHEAMISKMEARAKMWQDVSASVAKWGAVGIALYIATSVWHETVAAVTKAIGR